MQPEDEQVDAEQHERIEERPDDAEHRALVLRLEVPPEEVREQLAVAEEIGVDRHRRASSVGTARAGKHSANTTRLPSRAVSTLAAARRPPRRTARRLALCCAARSRAGSSRAPDQIAGGATADTAPRRHRDLHRRSPPGIWLAVAVGPLPADEQLVGIFARRDAALRRRPRSTTSARFRRLEARAQVARRRDRPLDGNGRPDRPQRLVAVPLALLWLVGMTNAFNLLDNMDGLAASLAAIAAASSPSTP